MNKLATPPIVPLDEDIPQFYFTIEQLPDVMGTFFRALNTDGTALDEFRDMFDDVVNGDEEALSELEAFFSAKCEVYENDIKLLVNAGATKTQRLLNQHTQSLNQKYGTLQNNSTKVLELLKSLEKIYEVTADKAYQINAMLVDTVTLEKEMEDKVEAATSHCHECEKIIVSPYPSQRYCSAICRKKASNRRSRTKT